MNLRTACCALLMASALPATAADAQDTAVQSLVWRCWYDQNVHVTCVIQSLPTGDASFTPQVALPPTVYQLRTNPESFRNQFVHIPMYSPPVDVRLLGVLARGVMCGSRPHCTANFTAELPPAAELNAILQRTYEVDPAFTAPATGTLVAQLQ